MLRRLFKPRVLFFWISLCWSCFASAQINKITDLEVFKLDQKWRIVFEGTRPIVFNQFMLHKPERLVVDIENADLVRMFHRDALKKSPIKDVRVASHPDGRLRVVFDMSSPVTLAKYFSLPHSQGRAYRLVFDLLGQAVSMTGSKAKTTSRPVYRSAFNSVPAKHAIKPRPQVPVQIRSDARGKDIIIVVDPGHGGKDPGASGVHGVHEKNVVLSISKALAADINRQPGFKARLTRKGDYYLTLRQRLAIARKYHADMFVAIHADAYKNKLAQGASVFALSSRGATSEAARWIATKENESELVGGVSLTDKTDLLKSVLINLSQTATIRASLEIGVRIIHAIGKVAVLHHRKLEQAAFVVLKSPDIPSLLIETGFISNPREESRLTNKKYQQRLANAITLGMKSYFLHSPPRGTWVAQQKMQYLKTHKKYVVMSGDTLLGIAGRFNVSMSALKAQNHLKVSVLQMGQVLYIPSRG